MAEPAKPPRPAVARATVAWRTAGAAVLGAIIGTALAGIWHAAWQGENRACAGTEQICLGPAAAGIAAGIFLVVIGSLAGFAVLRVRPFLLTVPAAVVLAFVVAKALATAVPGGSPPAAWAFAAALAASLAFVALAATPGWSRLAGLVLLAVLLAGAAVVPGKIGNKIGNEVRLREQRAKLAGLRFPLMVPLVTGYKIADAYPVGGVLSVDMVPDSARRDRWGAESGQAAIARHGNIIVFASSDLPGASGGVSRQALTQATTSLRHTTISALLTME